MLGESRCAEQILLDFIVSRADGAIAAASVLVPPPKTLTKISLPLACFGRARVLLLLALLCYPKRARKLVCLGLVSVTLVFYCCSRRFATPRADEG